MEIEDSLQRGGGGGGGCDMHGYIRVVGHFCWSVPVWRCLVGIPHHHP